MVVSSVGDCAFVYGGYSRVKAQQQQAGGKGGGGGGGAEGKVHEDLWVLQLKNMANGGQPYWERVRPQTEKQAGPLGGWLASGLD